jgi:hypothetical protein
LGEFRVWISPETQHLLGLENDSHALRMFADFEIVESTTSRHNHDGLVKICMFFADQSHVDRTVEWVVARRATVHQRHIQAGCTHATCRKQQGTPPQTNVKVLHCLDDYAHQSPVSLWRKANVKIAAMQAFSASVKSGKDGGGGGDGGDGGDGGGDCGDEDTDTDKDNHDEGREQTDSFNMAATVFRSTSSGSVRPPRRFSSKQSAMMGVSTKARGLVGSTTKQDASITQTPVPAAAGGVKPSRRFSSKQSAMVGVSSKARSLVEDMPTWGEETECEETAPVVVPKPSRRFSSKQSAMMGVSSKARGLEGGCGSDQTQTATERSVPRPAIVPINRAANRARRFSTKQSAMMGISIKGRGLCGSFTQERTTQHLLHTQVPTVPKPSRRFSSKQSAMMGVSSKARSLVEDVPTRKEETECEQTDEDCLRWAGVEKEPVFFDITFEPPILGLIFCERSDGVSTFTVEVAGVIPGGPAAQLGCIAVGDQVLAVGGETVRGTRKRHVLTQIARVKRAAARCEVGATLFDIMFLRAGGGLFEAVFHGKFGMELDEQQERGTGGCGEAPTKVCVRSLVSGGATYVHGTVLPGDRIVAIEDEDVRGFHLSDIHSYLADNLFDPITVTFSREVSGAPVLFPSVESGLHADDYDENVDEFEI